MSAGEYAAVFDGAGARRTYFSFFSVVVMPFGIGMGAGVYVGFVAMAFTWMMDVHPKYALVPASIAALTAWLLALRWVREINRELNYNLMMMARGRMILDQPVRIENHLPDGRTTQITDLAIDYETMVKVGKRVLDGATISQGNMIDIFKGNRAAFQQFQVKLVAAGWAKWRSDYAPQQGIEVTEAGMAEFRRACNSGVPLPHPRQMNPETGQIATRTRAHAAGYTVFDE